MARKQVGTAPSAPTDAVTKAYADSLSGGGGATNVFVQPTNPNMTEPGLWIDTSGGNFTFWIEDGE